MEDDATTFKMCHLWDLRILKLPEKNTVPHCTAFSLFWLNLFFFGPHCEFLIIDSFQFPSSPFIGCTCLFYFNYSFTTPEFPANLQGWVTAYISILQRCCQAMLEKLWNHINLVHYNILLFFLNSYHCIYHFKSPPVSLRSLILNSTAVQCNPRAIYTLTLWRKRKWLVTIFYDLTLFHIKSSFISTFPLLPSLWFGSRNVPSFLN